VIRTGNNAVETQCEVADDEWVIGWYHIGWWTVSSRSWDRIWLFIGVSFANSEYQLTSDSAVMSTCLFGIIA